jgi:hypothetical protein
MCRTVSFWFINIMFLGSIQRLIKRMFLSKVMDGEFDYGAARELVLEALGPDPVPHVFLAEGHHDYDGIRTYVLGIAGDLIPKHIAASVSAAELERANRNYGLLPPEYQQLPEVADAGRRLQAALDIHYGDSDRPALPDSRIFEEPKDLEELV